MSKRSAYLIAALMGTLLAVLSVFAVLAYSQAHETKAAQVRSDHDIAVIASRVFRIESPTPAEFNARLLNALKKCRADRACLRLFVATAPKGPRGARGPRGRRGEQGARGLPGIQGRPGMSVPGQRGKTGRPGSTGAPGRDATTPTPALDSRLVDGLENRVAGLERRVTGLLSGLCTSAVTRLLGLLGFCP